MRLLITKPVREPLAEFMKLFFASLSHDFQRKTGLNHAFWRLLHFFCKTVTKLKHFKVRDININIENYLVGVS